ncbi:sensor domain-containing diguanylate cyclase [Blautia schinkii]|nr:sensor domain-containing diguanylate cyclase [Blautia schinkii]
MKKNVLFRTNLLVCAVIVIGFIITVCMGYQSNQSIFRKDMEQVSVLTSEGIYHKIDSIFTKPINIALTMANDSLLKEFLEGEQQHLGEKKFTEIMQEYLNAYREKYDYDSVFLASAKTKRYYYFKGLDRVLDENQEENAWFYNFLQSSEDYAINIDNDEVKDAGNEVTIFINSRIKDESGNTMGVVGVGFRVDYLQSLLKEYENKFGITAYLVDNEGNVQISTKNTGYEGRVNHFEVCPYSELKKSLLDVSGEQNDFWYDGAQGSGYVTAQYINNLDWHLLVENDTTSLDKKLARQLLCEVLIVLATIFIVLFTITNVMHRYNKKIVDLTVATEQEHRSVFQKATEQLYENIYEIDITHNRAASEATESYFESLGAPSNIPFDRALQVIAEKQIKEEYRQGYLDAFSPDKVLEAYEEGKEKIKYEFMISNEGDKYYWMRITAQLFFWGEDSSVRMMVYRENIDAEKRRELYMSEQIRNDSLTGVYNKAATQDYIKQMLLQNPNKKFVLFIFDIDDFKSVNDTLGHASGDEVLTKFAQILKDEFKSPDVVGRIGGDEFIAFMQVQEKDIAVEKAKTLSMLLCKDVWTEAGVWHMSASIGLAFAPEAGMDFKSLYRKADSALYKTKNGGKNGYNVYNT